MSTGNVSITLPPTQFFKSGSIVSVLLTIYPHTGNHSDIVDLSFYDHGTHKNYDLALKIGDYLDLKILNETISMHLDCNIEH